MGIGATLLEDAKYSCFVGFNLQRFRVSLSLGGLSLGGLLAAGVCEGT